MTGTELVDLYWQVGAYISRKIEAAEWGDGVARQLADYLARQQPGLWGFTRANLFRMQQFYELYWVEKKVAPLVRQLSWSHNLVVLGQSKQPEEREFYLRMAIQEHWSCQEPECQIKSSLFERSLTHPAKVSTALRPFHRVMPLTLRRCERRCRHRVCARFRLWTGRGEDAPNFIFTTPSQTSHLARHVGVSLN
ncbi:hypothetical protein PCL1391_2209 [Pseudomonas chlororaphis subsp. piscium]|nr:hypothetical protein C4K33_2428 [Pseudomonas chlororaphis subsp. piscium]KZO49254.1 hypothetical protein PCL1391_2209 [Pseudomonas chlororaphis subsp. piscium]